MGEKPTSAGAVNPGGGKHMSDNQDTQVSESDAELEREIRKERKFTLAEAIGRLAGPGAMKGESPVTRLQQAEAQIESWLRSHLADAGGVLRVVLYRHVKGSELLLNNFDQPLVVLASYCLRILDSGYLLEELVRDADVEWGRVVGERPYFEKEGSAHNPDDPYTVELTLPDPVPADQAASPDHLNIVSDVVLAGIVTCGFAVFYNTAWRQLWMATSGGMAGHGLRFLAMEAGCRLEAATFLGGLAVGVISAWMARSRKMPVAVIAFAGAVTMIPGLHIYRALGGALRLARLGEMTDPGTVALKLGNALQGCIVVSGLALGLILGERAVRALAGERDFQLESSVGHDPDEDAHRVPGDGGREPERGHSQVLRRRPQARAVPPG